MRLSISSSSSSFNTGGGLSSSAASLMGSTGGGAGLSGAATSSSSVGGIITPLSEIDDVCMSIIEELSSKCPNGIVDAHAQFQDIFLSIQDRHPLLVSRLIESSSRLFALCPALVDSCTLALRKASFSTDVSSRQSAVVALTSLLNVHMRGLNQSAMTTSSSSVNGNSLGTNRGASLRLSSSSIRLGLSVDEIFSLLRRFLQHQASVRSILYNRLHRLQEEYPILRGTVLKFLHGHLKRYLVSTCDDRFGTAAAAAEAKMIDGKALVDSTGHNLSADSMVDLLTTLLSVSSCGLMRKRKQSRHVPDFSANNDNDDMSSSFSQSSQLEIFTQVDYQLTEHNAFSSSSSSSSSLIIDLAADDRNNEDSFDVNPDALEALKSIYQLIDLLAHIDCDKPHVLFGRQNMTNASAHFSILGSSSACDVRYNLDTLSDISPEKVSPEAISILSAVLDLARGCLIILPALPLEIVDADETVALDIVVQNTAAICERLSRWSEAVCQWHSRLKRELAAEKAGRQKKRRKAGTGFDVGGRNDEVTEDMGGDGTAAEDDNLTSEKMLQYAAASSETIGLLSAVGNGGTTCSSCVSLDSRDRVHIISYELDSHMRLLSLGLLMVKYISTFCLIKYALLYCHSALSIIPIT